MIEAKYSNNIRPILDKFDKIREILKDTKIDIPKIVAVGDQSSGKSSVLDSISGIALPKGGGRVTRCPIEIQLRKEDKNGKKGYAKIQIEGDESFKQCTFEELKQKIKVYQKRILEYCEKEKKIIVDKVIKIQVFNEKAPDLTLIDLPGLTYIDGKAETEIKKLYKKYTSGLNTIILLVVSGHNEIDSSESYKCINLNNTIPIYTKIDQILSLKGEDEKLYNKVMNAEIKTGYRPIIVRNRSEEEIKDNVFVDEEELRKIEKESIDNNEYLNKLDESCKGIYALVTLLIEIQKKLLIESRKGILEQIKKEINKLEKEIINLPPSSVTPEEKMNIFDKCCRTFQDLIDNNNYFQDMNIECLIRKQFEEFKEEFKADFNEFISEEYVKKISEAVDNSIGLQLENFFNDRCVYSLIQEKISDYFSIDCIDFINKIEDILQNYLSKYIQIAFETYPDLSESIIIEFENQLKSQKEKLINFYEMISNLERDNIFTMDSRYMSTFNKLYHEVLDSKKEQKTNNSTNFFGNTVNNNNSLFCNQNIQTVFSVKEKNVQNVENVSPIKEKKDYSMFYQSNDNVIKVVISIYAYCRIFENRFLDYFYKYIIKAFIQFFIKDPTRIIRNKFKPDMIYDRIEIIQKRDITMKQLKALTEAKQMINNIL